MKANHTSEFVIHKEQHKIHVKRVYEAPLSVLWKAWTTAELLDQWWGPNPWRAETKTMDFHEGGIWHYAMVSPEGEKHWSSVSYLAIEVEKSFTAKDGFSDEHAVLNPAFPQNLWKTSFTEQGNLIEIDILLTFDSLRDLEKTMDMGFQEGFTIGLDQLEKLLSTIK